MPISFNQNVIDEFRANGGKVGGPFEGGDLLLLTTTGARSGQPHTVPLGYVREEGELVVIASAGGAPDDPHWYRNLLANPVVRVELGTETFDSIAVPTEGARRERLFAAVVRIAPGYGDYQARTERELPVVVLERPETPTREVLSLADKLLEAHTWLRAQLRYVREEAQAHVAGRRASLGLQMRQHCLAFCEGLTHHHRGEDAAIFPALARSHPELAGTLDALGEQHRAIGRIKDELVALLAAVEAEQPERLRADVERMAAELEAHLAYEEAELLPALAGIPFPPVG
ncbi:nitroreductase/quinone reductase family protein [Streptomyces sp. SP17BM10]|uniref:nitroreductase/quinone reductase family protein n=1 Tax=Streptomyces sp. SP17BM10 TaxID=3002530 RepID=UPI002E78EDEE|nr:nitroreductase/quinone reductase family protein [Streptomyces sp. SP17BM10]MEE1787467.1 nitroreductase/quinone reductase family protein [Streptomyces sp. SP17BM10]